MRILQVIQQPQLRGAEIFACQLASELRKNGHAVDVACLFDSGGALKEIFPDLTFIHIGAVKRRRLFDYRALVRLNRIILDGGYEIVQANAGDTLKFSVFSRTLFKWEAILVFRNANKLSDFIRGSIHAAFNRWLLARCDHFFSVSEYCRQDLIAFYPAAAAISTTISIGTQLTNAPKLKRDPGEPTFINISSFVPEKNHQFLIQVFALFVGQHKTGRLVLVGDGRLRPQLETECARLGITQRVDFKGYQRDIMPHLAHATAMLITSKTEGLPAVILESMAARVPVIASGVGGIPEIVQDGITGVCLVGFEGSDYVEAMWKVVSNESLAERLTENGFRVVSQHFTLPYVSGKFESAYANLLKLDIHYT